MKIFASAAVLLCLTTPVAAQEPAKPPNLGPPAEPSVAPAVPPPAAPAPGKQVEVEACPEKGVEGNCVLIRYGEDVFNITGADPKIPLNGKGIKLRGEIDPDTASICFATTLKNITWEQTDLQCPGTSASPQNIELK